MLRRVCMLSLLLAALPLAAADEPPYKRLLTGDDAKKAAELEKKTTALQQAGQYADAIQAAEELLALRREQQGERHWQTVDARWGRDTLRKIGKLPADQRERWRKGIAQDRDRVQTLYQQGRFAQAEALVKELMDFQRDVVGEDHPETALSYNNLAVVLHAQARYDEGTQVLRRALEIQRRVLGDAHPDTARSCNNLSALLQSRGQYAEAEPLVLLALSIYRVVLGENHPDTALGFNNLAGILQSQGKVAAAEPLYRQCLGIQSRLLGKKHAATALSYRNLAANLSIQRRDAEAEPLFHEALAIYREALGEEHPDTARAYNSLAANLNNQQRGAEAEPHFLKALAIYRKSLGEKHPDTASAYHNLANTLTRTGRAREAEPLFRQALASYRTVLGDDHPITAQRYLGLARALHALGQTAEAETIVRKSLASLVSVRGEHDLDTARSHDLLAELLNDQGKYDEAELQWIAASKGYESARLAVSPTGLGRTAFADRDTAAPLLIACLARNGKPAEAWQRLEQHLARGLLDDFAMRISGSRDPDDRQREQELRLRLQRHDQQLAAHLQGKDPLGVGRPRLQELAAQRQSVLTELTQLDARAARELVYDLSRIQSALPADAALLAWVDVRGVPGAADPGGEHWACVVRSTGPPRWVKLPGSGPDAIWTKEDDGLPQKFRESLTGRPRASGDRTPDSEGSTSRLSQRLARQRLAPLEKHLENVTRLLVSPIGSMAGVPIEALSDRYTISYAPSGSTLVRLREQREKQPIRSAGLLALGDPVFSPAGETQPKDSAAIAAYRGPAFGALPGTRREVEAIAALFGKETRLILGSDASEQRLREMAVTDELRRFRCLHFATHGRVDHQRLLQTALILSQDRLPDPAGEVLAGRTPIDGCVSAQEILDGWRLDAELVTLSACQTGLGRLGGGDGFVGFPQVLLLAGARCVVLSLWQVNDTATALLMVRFYENWLGKRPGLDNSMPKAEALKEAKHWLRNLTRKEVEERIANLPEAARGLKLEVEASATPPAAGDKPFAHPFYWSAFILIGDPE